MTTPTQRYQLTIPPPVEAIQYTGENAAEVVAWAAERATFGSVFLVAGRLRLAIPGGTAAVITGDWILCDNGGIDRCFNDHFAGLYQPVEPPADTKRLDWIEKHKVDIEYDSKDGAFDVDFMIDGEPFLGGAGSVREAIDIGIQQTEKGVDR